MSHFFLYLENTHLFVCVPDVWRQQWGQGRHPAVRLVRRGVPPGLLHSTFEGVSRGGVVLPDVSRKTRRARVCSFHRGKRFFFGKTIKIRSTSKYTFCHYYVLILRRRLYHTVLCCFCPRPVYQQCNYLLNSSRDIYICIYCCFFCVVLRCTLKKTVLIRSALWEYLHISTEYRTVVLIVALLDLAFLTCGTLCLSCGHRRVIFNIVVMCYHNSLIMWGRQQQY